jgi:antitoxin component YwqK of YwqJK toxin-antitoxin module
MTVENYKNGKKGVSVYYPSGKLLKKPIIGAIKEGVYKSFLITELYWKNRLIRIMNIMDQPL